MLVLQALSEFGIMFGDHTLNGFVTVTSVDTGRSTEVDISGDRSLLLQTVEVCNSVYSCVDRESV